MSITDPVTGKVHRVSRGFELFYDVTKTCAREFYADRTYEYGPHSLTLHQHGADPLCFRLDLDERFDGLPINLTASIARDQQGAKLGVGNARRIQLGYIAQAELRERMVRDTGLLDWLDKQGYSWEWYQPNGSAATHGAFIKVNDPRAATYLKLVGTWGGAQ